MDKKTAYFFPGQGSQSIGMGLDIYREFDYAKTLFDMAEEETGLPIKRLCFEGPMEELTQTVNLQPALTTVSLALLAALENEGCRPDFAAGHSLGEFSALCAAGVLTRRDTIRLVHQRGVLMHREAVRHEGAMSALLGLTIDSVEKIVEDARQKGSVSVANHNMEKQIVITGQPEAVAFASETAAQNGAKAIPLNVSGAWHSELIRGAESEFGSFLSQISFSAPRFPVIHNVSADDCLDPAIIPSILARQLCSPVRWYDSMIKLIDNGVTVFAEIGPGKVLTGLIKKTLPKGGPEKVYSINGLDALKKFLQETA